MGATKKDPFLEVTSGKRKHGVSRSDVLSIALIALRCGAAQSHTCPAVKSMPARLLLLPFFEEEFKNLSDQMQLTFVKLLEQDDPDLQMWFSNKSVPEDEVLAELVKVILDRVRP